MTLRRPTTGIIIGLFFTLSSACSTTGSTSLVTPTSSHSIESAIPSSDFVVATWNTEHLAFPNSQGCRPRNEEEVAKLQHYATSLNADIIALQEVASLDAVESIFPSNEWQVVMSERPDSESYTCRKSGTASTQQKVAFAVRKEIDILAKSSLEAFGLGNPGLRHGLQITVNSSQGPMNLLNVHMKSGCFVDNYSRADSDACLTYAKQAPVLNNWVEKQEKEGTPYVVLGDFNHRLSAPYNHLSRLLSTNSDKSPASIENIGSHLIGCHPYYPAPIDHILVGNMPTKGMSKTAKMHFFDDMTPKSMLSDHCALSVTLSNDSVPISNSVKWQTTSKEYRYLTSSIYKTASEALINKRIPSTHWVVVMDVDETVLDNSQYQVTLEKTGQNYTPKSWNDWVSLEQATLVPGVQQFIETVFKLGGKLALVTNRDRIQDQHTWRNLQALNLPVSVENTCLTGRDSKDKQAINGKSIINDKDLRRQQLESGTAICYQPKTASKPSFPSLKIVMQIGDNIEDFAGITQETANIETLLSNSKSELILLPNPMYGSW